MRRPSVLEGIRGPFELVGDLLRGRQGGRKGGWIREGG